MLEQKATQMQGDPCSFYNLAMLLFPEVQSANPLDIDIMDTLFFLPDRSICYLYNVPTD